MQVSDFEYLTLLSTYRNWPESSPILPYKLASAGFAYTHFKDIVRCHKCKLEKGNWTGDLDPLIQHRLGSNDTCGSFYTPRDPSSLTLFEPQVPKVQHYYEEEVDLAKNAAIVKELEEDRKLKCSKDLILMKEENHAIKKLFQCQKCEHTEVESLFLPCRHLVTCEACSDLLDCCSYCGTKIMGTVRVHV